MSETDYVEILRQYNEAIALDYVVPFRVIEFPALQFVPLIILLDDAISEYLRARRSARSHDR